MHPEHDAGLLRAVALFAMLAAVAAMVAMLVRRPNAGPIELSHRLNRALPLDAPPVAWAGNAHR